VVRVAGGGGTEVRVVGRAGSAGRAGVGFVAGSAVGRAGSAGRAAGRARARTALISGGGSTRTLPKAADRSPEHRRALAPRLWFDAERTDQWRARAHPPRHTRPGAATLWIADPGATDARISRSRHRIRSAGSSALRRVATDRPGRCYVTRGRSRTPSGPRAERGSRGWSRRGTRASRVSIVGSLAGDSGVGRLATAPPERSAASGTAADSPPHRLGDQRRVARPATRHGRQPGTPADPARPPTRHARRPGTTAGGRHAPCQRHAPTLPLPPC
jgi:hypothetical protein